MVAAIIVDLFFPATQNREALHIYRVNEVKAESGWEMLTDRATIKVPKNLKAFDQKKVREVFRRGDPIQVNMGVNGKYNREFTGYISDSISADIPITIKCEDEMYKLKKIPVNACMEDTTLQNFLSSILSGYTIDALDIQLKDVRYSQTTVSEVLDDIEEKYGLKSYFQNGKLVVGKIYLDNTATHKMHLEKQVYKNNLKYRRADDRLIKVKGISTLKDGSKIEVEVGDESGELQVVTFFNIDQKAELEKLTKLEYEKFKVDGYDGTIEIPGWIKVQHGDKIELVSDIYPEQNGTYYIDKVDPKLNDSPEYIKTLAIGPKVA
jgi:hypothetical protein